VLLANMIEAWLVGNPEGVASAEAGNELEDHGATPEQTGLYLCPPVDECPGAPPPGKHGATYALRTMALELGWSESAIRMLDRDLGMTGTEMTRREDFKTLVADVSMGQSGRGVCAGSFTAGALESGLAPAAGVVRAYRDLGDRRRRLLRFVGFNDGLLLGLKGTMAQAELHFLHARLQGGQLNKGKKGELRFPLPVGYCYDEEGRASFRTPMQKCGEQWKWCFVFLAKRAAPMPSYIASRKRAYDFPSEPTAGHGMARLYGAG